jgi:hypothetical protein
MYNAASSILLTPNYKFNTLLLKLTNMDDYKVFSSDVEGS